MIDLPWDAPTVSEYMSFVARGLARAFLHEAGNASELQARGRTALGKKWPWLSRMTREILDQFGSPLHAKDFERIVSWIEGFPPFSAAFDSGQKKPPRLRCYFSFHREMLPAIKAFDGIDLPRLHTIGDLAKWLGLSASELNWFADLAGWGGRAPGEMLRHYNYQWKAKRSGGLRLIESPKSRLRDAQRKILTEILNKLPVHPAAHGCMRQHSVLTNARLHAGAPILIHLDIRDFFSSVNASRIHALYRSMGYTQEVSRYLTGLTTHCTPYAVLCAISADMRAPGVTPNDMKKQTKKFLSRHLPQGAPTSAALANLCSYRLDLRLDGAAKESNAAYTRYVDDIVYSCQTYSVAHAKRIALMASTIILEEGFEPHPNKTRIMTRSQAQRVTGLVVNVKPNIARTDYDELKAVLTNCARHGTAEQNRTSRPDFRSHLLGRISWVKSVNPARGERLQTLFDGIDWFGN